MMPVWLAWLLPLLAKLALPVLLVLLRAVFAALETKYPGIKPLLDSILKFLESGGSAQELQSHCEAMPGFCPVDVKHD